MKKLFSRLICLGLLVFATMSVAQLQRPDELGASRSVAAEHPAQSIGIGTIDVLNGLAAERVPMRSVGPNQVFVLAPNVRVEFGGNPNNVSHYYLAMDLSGDEAAKNEAIKIAEKILSNTFLRRKWKNKQGINDWLRRGINTLSDSSKSGDGASGITIRQSGLRIILAKWVAPNSYILSVDGE